MLPFVVLMKEIEDLSRIEQFEALRNFKKEDGDTLWFSDTAELVLQGENPV